MVCRSSGLLCATLTLLGMACSQEPLVPFTGQPTPCRIDAALEPIWHTSEGLITSRGSALARSVCLRPEVATALAPLADEASAAGLLVKEGSDCDLSIELALGALPDAALVPSELSTRPQGFSWVARRVADEVVVTIYAADAAAAHPAAHTLLATGGFVWRAAADGPGFGARGVIEGFYHQYFSRQERAVTLTLMHALRMNRYMYCPKDDLFAGYRWRDPYPESPAADIAAAAALSDKLGIRFIYGISPMLSANGQDLDSSYCFTSQEDFTALVSKLQAVRQLGVTHFALLFDDAGHDLVHPEDRAAFADLASAHADLANRLVRELGGPLFIVGDYYTSAFDGWQGYYRTLGAALDPAVRPLWTGPTVFSKTISAADLTEVNGLLGRPVALWDNWPTEATPFGGRAVDLDGATDTILTNATLVGDYHHPVADFWKVLGPLADYAWSPERYDAEVAYRRWQELVATATRCAGDAAE